ncbi:unnamed protein product [Ilex paraguariensis]|uniref:ABC transmembrane type-1 domain-containing protein n=1 Tax=Ilex paraguariensis TaxID=185542 RepID=A0ABC8UR76_9AQUA
MCRSHTELLQDPEGAYSQLIRLQALNKESEHHVVNGDDRSEITLDSPRHPSQRISFLRSISGGSSGNGNSSRHSFSVSMGVPTSVSFIETSLAESKSMALAPSKMAQEVPLRRLAYLNKPEIPVLLVGSTAAVANGVVLPLFGVLLSIIIKIFYEPAHKLRKDSEFWASMFVVLGVLSLLATSLRTYFFSVAGCKLIKRMRLMCFEKLVHMEISWFDKTENSIGAISARLSTDATSVRSLIGDTLALLVQNTATAIAGLIIGFQASWQLALIILAMLPLIGMNGYFHMKFLSGFSKDAKKLYEDASQVASDAVRSIRTVASFCAEEKVMQLYHKKSEGPVRAGIKQGFISGAAFGLSMLFLFLVYAATFYAGAQLVDAGKTTFHEVFQVFYGLTLTAVGISQSSSLAPDSSKARSGAASVFSLLDQKSDIDSSGDSGATPDNVKGDIEFRHVSFKYPARPDVQIFSDLFLAIHSGKVISLIQFPRCILLSN